MSAPRKPKTTFPPGRIMTLAEVEAAIALGGDPALANLGSPSDRATAIARGIVEDQLPAILGCAVIGGDLEGARAVLIERIAQAIERAAGGR